jgi:hypothetical protein
MSEVGDKLSSKEEIASGVSLIATDDWIKLSCFFSSVTTDSPDTEPRMRKRLLMTDADTFEPEFAQTVSLFKDLVALGKEFTYQIADEVRGLADDIVHYQVQADTVYGRLADLVSRFDLPGAADTEEALQLKFDELLKLWKDNKVSGNSQQIQNRFKLALESLITEAEARETRAKALEKRILGEQGLHAKLLKSKSEFDLKKEAFERKYGQESPRVTKFRGDVKRLQDELNVLRKKEQDEVIVLATSPVYLAIPLIGPLIFAGIDIGVGADLAITRAKIASVEKESREIEDELGRTERFMGYYNSGKTMTGEMSKNIENVAPRLQALGLGWRAIASDLTFIRDRLTGPGRSQIRDEDWFNFVTTLKTAQKTWKDVAAKADHLRTVAIPAVANDANDAVEKVKKAA